MLYDLTEDVDRAFELAVCRFPLSLKLEVDFQKFNGVRDKGTDREEILARDKSFTVVHSSRLTTSTLLRDRLSHARERSTGISSHRPLQNPEAE